MQDMFTNGIAGIAYVGADICGFMGVPLRSCARAGQQLAHGSPLQGIIMLMASRSSTCELLHICLTVDQSW